jgi:hypothetical protein
VRNMRATEPAAQAPAAGPAQAQPATAGAEAA